MRNKKGQLGQINGIILTLVVVMVLVGVAYLIGDQFLGTMTPGSSAYNSTQKVFGNLDTAVNFIPIIVIVALAGIVLYLVYRFGGGTTRA